MRIRFLATLVALLFLGSTASAADLAVIRTDSSQWPLVRVIVAEQQADISATNYTLTLPSGKTVAADRATELAGRERPASMVVALDTSRSLSPRDLEAAKKSLERYVDRLADGEQLSLLGFNDAVELVIGFTTDREAFKTTLSRLRPGGNRTELYQAMLYGIENLRNTPGQKTLLVITDGKDEGSAVTPDRISRAARESGVRILAIGLPVLPGKESETYLPRLERLASETGGVYRAAASPEELGEATYALMVENQGLATHVYELEFNLADGGIREPGAFDARLSRKDDAGRSAAVAFAAPRHVARPLAEAESVPAVTPGTPAGAVAGAPEAARDAVVAAPVAAQTAPEPPARRPERSIWPWLLLGLLALLLLGYLLRRKNTAPAMLPKNDDSQPLVIVFPDLDVSYPLRPGTMIVGSGPESDVRLDDPDIAEIHAEFCTGSDCELRASQGSHGVLLNGGKVEGTVKLKPGDTLTFGSTRAEIRQVTQ